MDLTTWLKEIRADYRAVIRDNNILCKRPQIDTATLPLMKCLEEQIEGANQLSKRIRDYLGCGGLINPEHMEHDKVRDLLMDIQSFLVS